MILDAENPEQQWAYRVVRKESGEVIPLVFYADTGSGEVWKWVVGDDGKPLYPTHTWGHRRFDGRWENFALDPEGRVIMVADPYDPYRELVRDPFQIVEWPSRTVIAETEP